MNSRLCLPIFLALCLHAGQSTAFAEIMGKQVTYPAGETALRGYLAWDSAKSGKHPAVLVVHEWWGHNDYARERAPQLAALGYLALAVDMYGDGKTADHPRDAGVDYEFVAYPGAVHGFTNPDATALGEKFGIRLAYDKAADQKSWTRLKKLLSEVF